MGLLFDGKWVDDESSLTGKSGEFKRPESPVRSWVTADGSAGPTGEAGFAAEPGRYHLYVAVNCPWAHRTMMFRHLKKLENVITLSHVRPRRGDEGWIFINDGGAWEDPIYGKTYLHEIYTQSHPNYTGRITVPVLWDKQKEVIVNNESSEIIRMLNTAFNAFTNDQTDYYPQELRATIDDLNERVYNTVNNGVYRAGYAQSQEAYEAAVVPLFETLDHLEDVLSKQRYLAGDIITEADWRLFPTLIRFDPAYVGAFKCNIRRLKDYPNLNAYTRELYQHPGIKETCDLDIYKQGYYSPSPLRNPLGIVPLGPDMSYLDEPHGRDVLTAA